MYITIVLRILSCLSSVPYSSFLLLNIDIYVSAAKSENLFTYFVNLSQSVLFFFSYYSLCLRKVDVQLRSSIARCVCIPLQNFFAVLPTKSKLLLKGADQDIYVVFLFLILYFLSDKLLSVREHLLLLSLHGDQSDRRLFYILVRFCEKMNLIFFLSPVSLSQILLFPTLGALQIAGKVVCFPRSPEQRMLGGILFRSKETVLNFVMSWFFP